MAERLIRMGKVSSIDYANGMISVTYPDLDNSTTDTFPVFSLTDEYKMPGNCDGTILEQRKSPSSERRERFPQGTWKSVRGSLHPVFWW